MGKYRNNCFSEAIALIEIICLQGNNKSMVIFVLKMRKVVQAFKQDFVKNKGFFLGQNP
jgi:hypothetical protein